MSDTSACYCEVDKLKGKKLTAKVETSESVGIDSCVAAITYRTDNEIIQLQTKNEELVKLDM